MSLIYRRRANQPTLTHAIYDYIGEIAPFARRVDRRHLLIPLVALKSIEWAIYRWYKTPVRRFYGVKGNELIYMITRACSDRCRKCGIWKSPEPPTEHLPIHQFLNCLNRLAENLYQVTLTGGEPLMYMDDVLMIGREAKRLDVPMIVVTNGTLLTESFLRQYSELGHVLVISLDTLEKDKWENFRGRNHYDVVMANIKLAKRVLGSNLRIQSVLAAETANDIPAIKAWCDEFAIPHVIQPYMDFGGSWNSASKGSGVQGACAARKNICVYPNGDVVKCFDHHRIPLAREPLGNIAAEDIVTILCKKRSTEVSKIMKTCDFPCKQLSCNVPKAVYNP